MSIADSVPIGTVVRDTVALFPGKRSIGLKTLPLVLAIVLLLLIGLPPLESRGGRGEEPGMWSTGMTMPAV